MFKDELEGLIQDQLTKGNNPTGLMALRQIADLVMASTTGGAGPLTAPISEWPRGLVCSCVRLNVSIYVPFGLFVIQRVSCVGVHQPDWISSLLEAEFPNSCDTQQPWNSIKCSIVLLLSNSHDQSE